MRVLGRRFVAVGSVVAFVACAPAGQDDVRAGATGILNGEPDTAHDAVVVVFNGKSLCSGTIFQKDVEKNVAWVVTAAHCVTPEPVRSVRLTRDWGQPGAKRFGVIDSHHLSTFVNTGSEISDDFAVVRIVGVDATTPVIPLAKSPDNLTPNATVRSVGFGTTHPNPSLDLKNKQRNIVTKTISVLSADFIEYDQTDVRGICSGDSGGPVLVGTGSDERIVGVHSFVSADEDEVGPEICRGRSASGRVTSAADFFAAETARPLPTATSCELCGAKADIATAGACAAAYDRCKADDHCRAFNNCLANGTATEDCRRQHPLGEGPYRMYASCSCTEVRQTCPAACANDPLRCKAVPKCGVEQLNPDCNTCVQQSCCKEFADCAADGQCFACILGNDADPACADNALRKAAATCAASKCLNTCRPEVESPDPVAEANQPAPPNASASFGSPESESSTRVVLATDTSGGGCAASGHGSASPGWMAFALAAMTAAVARRRRSA